MKKKQRLLTYAQALEAWHLRADGMTYRNIAAKLGCFESTVHQMITGKTYQDVTPPADIRAKAQSHNRNRTFPKLAMVGDEVTVTIPVGKQVTVKWSA